MTKRRKSTGKKRRPAGVSPGTWLQVAGVLLMATGLVTLLSLLSLNQGTLTGTWLRLLRSTFGCGVYILPLGIGSLGFWLFLFGFGRPIRVPLETIVGTGLLFLGALGLVHYFASEPQLLAVAGGGGGHLGWWISRTLIAALGDIGAILALLTVIAISLIALFSISIVDAVRHLVALWHTVANWFRSRSTGKYLVPASPEGQSLPERVLSRVEQYGQRPSVTATSTETKRQLPVPQMMESEKEWRLPSLEATLDESVDKELSESAIRSRVRLIEETLASFGVPATVVEVNQGPTVTQFGLRPGYVERRDRSGQNRQVKVKVKRISALANDLALALAASPIRIEAPVPGRSLVGIEVPNTNLSRVGLRGVMESDAFVNLDSKLRIALGQDVAGKPVVADLASMPHLLVAGATGSGKSVCLNSIISCLLLNNTPDDLRIIMIDPKMVELTSFNGIPHLLAPVVVETERAAATLRWITSEMDRRYRHFASAGARSITAYNRMMISQGKEKLPYIVVVVDELADLMMAAPDEIERSVCRIAQLARATGIHLVIATQRPSVDVVTGLIKANFPARISFTVFSQVDSRVILDTGGAEKLLGRGDMLYMASDSSKLRRLQGCFVADAEISRLVDYWKSFHTSAPLPPGASLVQQPLWPEMIAKEKEAASRDDLLDKAIEVVRELDRASISLLQRKLRIGYSRAARLIDTLEAQGLIGPQDLPGRGRQVYKPRPQDDSNHEG